MRDVRDRAELAADRASGWIRQLRITPLSGRAWVAAKTAEGALLPVPAAALVAITAIVSHGIHAPPQRWAELLVIVIAGSLPFSMLGIVIGQLLWHCCAATSPARDTGQAVRSPQT